MTRLALVALLTLMACGDGNGPDLTYPGLYRIADVNGGTAPFITWPGYAGWLTAVGVCGTQNQGAESTLVIRRDLQLATDSTFTTDYAHVVACFVGGTLTTATGSNGATSGRLQTGQLRYQNGWEISYPADVFGTVALLRLTRQ
jgi:hypothetical protein